MMIVKIIKKIFGTSNDRALKQYLKMVGDVNDLEEWAGSLSDEEIVKMRDVLYEKYTLKSEMSLIVPEAFAVVREASKRVLGLRHHDVQLVGGMALLEGNIAEMGTGEGKTLVATLAVYVSSIMKKKSHVVTVNDYLAKRDSEEMGKVYAAVGVTVGCNTSDKEMADKKEFYKSDVVYGTNSEFGFDYLRDNLVLRKEDKVQQELSFCIVDEVDSILIDEARTPLIISGASNDSIEIYNKVHKIIITLEDGDLIISEKDKSAQLNDQGFTKVEKEVSEAGLLVGKSLYGVEGVTLMHYISASLKANFIYKKDVDYLIKNKEVLIIDEFTGRSMDGRRWSGGLHQAIEAKEGVEIKPENETVASITYQNYFRMYKKLSGMTGTADTEAVEFQDIYGLNVICIPTDKKVKRIDENDKMFASVEAKYRAILRDIKESNSEGQPVLVGTPSVEVSEVISGLLKKEGIRHNVLNAKNHKKEAKIISQAGEPKSITIATNMAGRGTDIKLGGNKGKSRDVVLESGGLRVIGVERQDNRRLDNQLRGRSGRQGDAGSTCFYVSPKDNLMRIFGGERIQKLADMMTDGDKAIEHKFLNRGVTNAQKKIETTNYDVRKNIIKYDDVANDQRSHIYEIRNKILNLKKEEIDGYINPIAADCIADIMTRIATMESEEEKKTAIISGLGFYDEGGVLDEYGVKFEKINEALNELSGGNAYEYKRSSLLSELDKEWVAHLKRSADIREGVNLRGYAQKDPIKEFQKESFDSFKYMLNNFSEKVVFVVTNLHNDAMKSIKDKIIDKKQN